MNKNPLEKVIEKKVVAFAIAQGCYVRKFTSPAHRSVPDRMFLYKGRVWWIEFKRFGEKPTAAQAVEHAKIRDHGGKVYVVDEIEDGKKLISNIAVRQNLTLTGQL